MRGDEQELAALRDKLAGDARAGIHAGAIPTGHDVPTTRPRSRLSEHLESAATEHAEHTMRVHQGSPHDLPDAGRQLTMALGALEGLERRAADLVVKLSPVLRDGSSDHLAKLEESRHQRGADADELTPRCELGRRARDLADRLGMLEELLGMTAQLVEL